MVNSGKMIEINHSHIYINYIIQLMLRVKSADVNALKMPLIKGKEKT